MQPSNQPVVVTKEVLQPLYLMMQVRQVLKEKKPPKKQQILGL